MAGYRGLAGFLMFICTAGAVLRADPGQSASFDSYIARGYGEIAVFAATKVGNPALAAHFKRRAALASAGRELQPESLTSWHLDDGTAREAGAARRQLVDRLDAGARQRQPLQAAIAQVNFDCWVAPFPARAGLRDSSDCRRKFYIAFAKLAPARPKPNIARAVSADSALAFIPRLKPVLPYVPGAQVAAVPMVDPTADTGGPATCAAGSEDSCQSAPRVVPVAEAGPLAGLTDTGRDSGGSGDSSVASPRSVGRTPGNGPPSTNGNSATGGGSPAGSLGGAVGGLGGGLGLGSGNGDGGGDGDGGGHGGHGNHGGGKHGHGGD
jgi:hypothetical protein